MLTSTTEEIPETNGTKRRNRLCGKLNESERIACIICGKKYIRVCFHARKIHGLSPRDYKNTAGIPVSVGVVPLGYHEQYSQMGKSRELNIRNQRVTSGFKQTSQFALITARERLLNESKKRMAAWHSVWDARRDDFCRMWEAGQSIDQIKKAFGVTEGQIYKACVKFGLKPRVFRSGGRASKQPPHTSP